MQPTPEAVSRGPPEPYIIDGQRFYNVRQAAQIVGTITEATLWRWAKRGSTPFRFDLDIKQEPVTRHRSHHSSENSPANPRDFRMLIPESKVYALKAILQDDPIRPGPLSERDFRALVAATRQFR